ncbi:putative protein family PM-16 [Prochlorococcus sp. SS52]|uniref:Protein family PM-16 n=1 Tax=Prochlorococcus marinus (strain SARG / CCMP1375 / SS120) TaxID=167539 RepID=Q7VAH8_PROMA|nr:Predicted protein family PM-16 [Prochlorococcus marinus subsp. marinus str. CCMP1375]KGG10301.1 putative protein family PM-16 [Prochlorococcus marinus str. LG]KGG37425.1 putative protein family PM-16 [Prochlorococcus sp. SS52]
MGRLKCYGEYSMKKLITWHKSMLERAQKEMGLSNYTLYWMAFFEGALVMWIIMKIFSSL